MNEKKSMNAFDDVEIDRESFAFLNAQGKDSWQTFDPVFGALTIVGTPAYFGRLRFEGRKCVGQVRFSAGTSIASSAGTDYLTLPITAASASLSGMGVMTNDSTNVTVGTCHIDTATSRCYTPSQVASASVFTLFGQYEV